MQAQVAGRHSASNVGWQRASGVPLSQWLLHASRLVMHIDCLDWSETHSEQSPCVLQIGNYSQMPNS